MWQPFMCDDNFRMSFQPRFDFACLPIPKHNVPFTVTTTNPLAVGRKPNLACIASYRMSCEAFLTILPEIVGAVDKDLVV